MDGRDFIQVYNLKVRTSVCVAYLWEGNRQLILGV